MYIKKNPQREYPSPYHNFRQTFNKHLMTFFAHQSFIVFYTIQVTLICRLYAFFFANQYCCGAHLQ